MFVLCDFVTLINVKGDLEREYRMWKEREERRKNETTSVSNAIIREEMKE